MRRVLFFVASGVLAAASPSQQRVDYTADVRFAVDTIGRECKELLALKQVDWSATATPFLAAAEKTTTHEEHVLLLVRLLARVKDGHAELRPLAAGQDIKPDWPDRSAGPGLFLCSVNERWYVKRVWGPARSAGIEAGSELVSIDGVEAGTWIGRRRANLSETISFSTAQHALYYTTHQGLADAPGTSWKLELRDGLGVVGDKTLTLGRASQVPEGPLHPPPGLQYGQYLGHGLTSSGFGYVHVRRCRGAVVDELDVALATMRNVAGLILDFRGNSGGGFDHGAFLGRFIPTGKSIAFGGVEQRSAGTWSYGGPLVAIVDASVRSAGETASGMFKEEGRGYVIGESATAGMSSQKAEFELPSKLFTLRVSTRSNKQRWQGGRGLEGLGLEPHERIAYLPADLTAGRDTLIVRAEALLFDFPASSVPYVPAEYGWSPPRR